MDGIISAGIRDGSASFPRCVFQLTLTTSQLTSVLRCILFDDGMGLGDDSDG